MGKSMVDSVETWRGSPVKEAQNGLKDDWRRWRSI